MNLRWCRLLMASLCCTVNGTSLEGSQRAASLASPILLAYHWCVTSRTVIGTAAGATADLTLQCRCVGPVDETFMYFSTMWHLWGMTLVTGLSCIPGSELECVTETKCKLTYSFEGIPYNRWVPQQVCDCVRKSSGPTRISTGFLPKFRPGSENFSVTTMIDEIDFK